MSGTLTRRETLQLLGGAAATLSLTSTGEAGFEQGSDTPLLARTTGLEHLGFTVPDTHATAEFYGRIFNPQLFREREDENRLYVTAGTAYLAFGGNMPDSTPRIDHFCALMPDYDSGQMRPMIEAAGIDLTPGGFGMLLDPDGLRLQLLNVPGGLAGTIMPAGRISLDPPAVHAVGLDSIALRVSDLARSIEHYRKLFGREASNPQGAAFDVANTRLVLEQDASGETPSIASFCLTVAGFDRQAIAGKLEGLQVELASSGDDALLSFRDPHGHVVELKAA